MLRRRQQGVRTKQADKWTNGTLAKVGQRQIDLANKLMAAGVLTAQEHAAITARETPEYVGH